MKVSTKWNVSEEQKASYIDALLAELPTLRAKANIKQDELADMLDITRQTYSLYERGSRKMSWGVFLALILIFDCNKQTHDIIRLLGLFPDFLEDSSISDTATETISDITTYLPDDIREALDEQAIHSIETVVMLEYARCKNMTGNAVIKSFDGKAFKSPSTADKKIHKGLGSLKVRKRV